MMKKLIIVLLLLANPLLMMASDLNTLQEMGFSNEQVATLLKGERLDNLTNNEKGIILMPVTTITTQFRAALKTKKPATVIEALYYLPSYHGVAQRTLYNNLLKFSSLSGLEYYSRSEKRVKTLIYNVQVTAGPGSSEVLPDPTVTTVPAENQFYIRQDDETFGVADYEVNLLADSQTGELGIILTNMSVLKKSGLKMADTREMQTIIVAIPLSEGTLLYALTSSKKSPPAFLRDRMNQSLLNRLDAFRNWFASRYKA